MVLSGGRGGRRTVVADIGSASALVWVGGRGRIVEVPTRVSVPVPASDPGIPGGSPAGHPGHGHPVVDPVPGARRIQLVERGVVRHPGLLAHRLTDAAGGSLRARRTHRAARAVVSVPVDAGRDDVSQLVAALRRVVQDDRVTVLPAVVAAVQGLDPGIRSALVVDVGAQLVEVALVDDGMVAAAAVLDWGVDDLVDCVQRALAERHGVAASVEDVERSLVSGMVAGRDLASGAARVLRVESRLVRACAAGTLEWLHDALVRVGAGAPTATPLVAVGGGIRVAPVREHLRTHADGHPVQVSAHPRHATLCGLAAATGDPTDRIGLPALLAAHC